jgi:hypothetical protein
MRPDYRATDRLVGMAAASVDTGDLLVPRYVLLA